MPAQSSPSPPFGSVKFPGDLPNNRLTPLGKDTANTASKFNSDERRSSELASSSVGSEYSNSAPSNANVTEFALPVKRTDDSESSTTSAHDTNVRFSGVTKRHFISAPESFQLFSKRIASSRDDCMVLALAESAGIEEALNIALLFRLKPTKEFVSALKDLITQECAL